VAKGSLGKYQIEWVPLSAVREHPKNPRIGEVEKIAASIEANDFYTPIVAQRSTRFILIGNHRWKAAKEVGLKEVPVIFHDIADAPALAIMLSDNKSSDRSRYDQDRLIQTLEEFETMAEDLEELDFEASLFTTDELEKLKGIDDGYDDVEEERQEEAEYKRRVTECPRCSHIFVPDTFVEREDR
jgi:ParB-like chromosome segregation protein Spo0J